MNPVMKNPLRTRGDMALAAVQILKPLAAHMSEGKALIKAGDTGAVYPDRIAQMEAYSRALWAIVPMLAGKCPEVEPLWALWREGLANGVNPAHVEYWGDIGPYDQRMVEMAVMGIGLCIAPDRFWSEFDEATRANLHRWLSQINDYEMPANNWVFFRILVNIGFQCVGMPCSEARLERDLALVEEHYEGDGWYYDYPTQRDYYAPWGFQYYGLVYTHVMRARDAERSARFLARGRQFAPQFGAWFAADGEALAYGRSQTYRFAQGSFYAAQALAEQGPGAPWGVMKGNLLRNLRKWLARPIFTGDGLLSIGYGYPNLHMAEGYNAPGSPYWAMKAFMVLALPEDHPFWQAEEAFEEIPPVVCEKGANMLLVRDAQGAHVQGFSAGNHAPGHEQSTAKYEKFAYSTAFAFSVSRSSGSLREGAFDSALALTDDGIQWRTRYGCASHEIREDRVLSVWKPYADVTVETEIIPLGEDVHLRVHTIETPRPLAAAEGGYAIRRPEGEAGVSLREETLAAAVLTPWGASGILAKEGYERAMLEYPAPNTNMLYPRTALPMLLASVPPGKTRLVCKVLGAVSRGEEKWAAMPGEE